MAHFDGDADRSELAEGHSFDLGGQTFRTKPTWPPSLLADPDADLRGFAGLVTFLRAMVVKEDRDRFNELLDGDSVFVTDVEVSRVAAWLLGVIAGRPTSAPDSSTSGRETTSGMSVVGSPARDATGAS